MKLVDAFGTQTDFNAATIFLGLVFVRRTQGQMYFARAQNVEVEAGGETKGNAQAARDLHTLVSTPLYEAFAPLLSR